MPTSNKECEGPNKGDDLELNFKVRSSAELNKLMKVKQEEVYKRLGRTPNQEDEKTMKVTNTTQCGENTSLKRKLCSLNTKSSQVLEKAERQQKITKMTSQMNVASQVATPRPLTTNVTQPTQGTQKEKRLPKKKAIATSEKDSNQSEHDPKVGKRNAICQAMSIDEILKENGVCEEENHLLNDEQQQTEDERLLHVDEVNQNHVNSISINQDVEEMNNNVEGNIIPQKIFNLKSYFSMVHMHKLIYIYHYLCRYREEENPRQD